jgi:hypothetical protein
MEPTMMPQLLAVTLLGGLGDPLNILGGLVVGWFCRRWWQVVAAAVVLHALRLAVFLPGSLPPEATIVWAAMPLGLVGPVAWCAAGFALRRHVATPGSKGERVVSAVAGLVLGGVAGGFIGLGLGQLYVVANKVSNFEGAAGYAVFFLFVLPGIPLGAVLGAILAWRWSRPRAPG